MEIKTHGHCSAQKDQIWSEESEMRAQFSIRIISTLICFFFFFSNLIRAKEAAGIRGLIGLV